MGTLKVGDSQIDLTLAVGAAAGGTPQQEVTYSGSVTVNMDLKHGSSLQFVCRGYAPEAAFIDELATDVWLLGEINLRLRATAVWQEWFQNGQDNVSVLGSSYKKLLNRRLVHGVDGLSFPTTDMGDIVWGMWNHTQSQTGGNLGITKGASTTGIVRTRTYKQGENLGAQAEEEYEEGFAWDIDSDLVYTAAAITDGPVLDQPLHLGVNCRGMQRASGSEFANAVYGDADDESTVGVWEESLIIGSDPRGRWETAVGWPTVVLQETLDDRTAAALAESTISVSHWNIDLEPSRWVTDSRLVPGMFAQLVVPRTLAAPIGQPTDVVVVLVTSVSINFTQDGALNVKAVVVERPDVTLPI